MPGEAAASAGRHRRRALRWALGLVSGLLLLEVAAAAVLTGSLALLGDAVLLPGLAGVIIYEAIGRFRSPPVVDPGPMVLVMAPC